MPKEVKGKHAAGSQPANQTPVGAPVSQPVVQTEYVHTDKSGNKMVMTVNPNGGWTPVTLKKKNNAARIFGIVLAVLVALVAAAYAGGWWYFSNHVFPNTTLAGMDMSYKTTEEFVQIAESIGSNYTLVVRGDNASFTASAKDVAAGVDGKAVADRVINTRAALEWPLELTREHDVSNLIIEEFNMGGFEADLRRQVEDYNVTAKEPEDAYIDYDAEAGKYLVVPEVPGTKLEVEPVLAAAKEALLTMQPEATIPANAIVPAKITQDDERLVGAVNKANNYCKARLDLVLGTTEIHAKTIDSTQIAQWVSIKDDYEVVFDEETMNSWIADLANSLNTVGTERTYTRPDGATFTVSGGLYGWEIDNESLITQVRDGIKEGWEGTITVPTFTEGYTWNGAGVPDWGAYADVSLSEQHARFYNEAGELVWESDVITGSPDGKHDTPEGIWRILYKESPAVLKGEIQEATNQPEYETKVKYWMPFTYQGHGFHDATWQWAFGGNSYAIGYGSHGCVNLPYDAAERLYGLIANNNAVIVHW